MLKKAFIITTINKPNLIMKLYAKMCKAKFIDYYIIGDAKSPKNFKLKNSNYFNIKDQEKLEFSYAKKCLKNAYVRKNIGYLIAIRNKADVIIESDDDNLPLKNFFNDISIYKKCILLKNKKWINIFNYFLKDKKKIIWPRGFPLDEIKAKNNFKGKIEKVYSPIQQHLSNKDPDVDAIYRLTHKETNINFLKKTALGIYHNTYSTFNSQNTRWFKCVFPLLYLPTCCTFRACDIWRGLIALRVLHANNMPLTYSSATNLQQRNYHNIFNDFKDEIPFYLKNKKIINYIYSIKLPKGEKNIIPAMKMIYAKLVKEKVFPKNELVFLNCWINDVKKII